jgi:hypothetical protein
MRTEQINIITLEPEKGKVLTNGKIYSYKVYLGVNDSPDNWWEISEEDVPQEENI